MFQSTLPHGERPRCDAWWQAPACFNPRSHTGSDADICRRTQSRRCFNPRSHTGSDVGTVNEILLTDVSIHAPTRGATACSEVMLYGAVFQSTLPHGERRRPFHKHFKTMWVSIHAPTRGATSETIDIKPSEMFQSTLPHGERLFRKDDDADVPEVSIHAPTRGATV